MKNLEKDQLTPPIPQNLPLKRDKKTPDKKTPQKDRLTPLCVESFTAPPISQKREFDDEAYKKEMQALEDKELQMKMLQKCKPIFALERIIDKKSDDHFE